MTAPQPLYRFPKWQLINWLNWQRQKEQPVQQNEVRAPRNLLMRLIIGGTTMIVSVSAYYSYQVVRNLTLTNLKQNAFLEVQQGVDEVDGWLATRLAEIEALANTPMLRTMDWSVAGPYLKSEVLRLHEYSHLTMVNPDGSYYTTKVDRASGNLSDRPFFQMSMQGKIAIPDPVIARSTGRPIISISVPILAGSINQTNGKPPIGIVAGNISLDRVSQVVNSLEYGQDSYAFALNSKGQAIVHPNTALMSTLEKPAPSLLESTDSSLAATAQRMVDKQQGIELISIDGTEKYVAFVPLQQTNWSIALVIPRQNIEAQLRPLDLMALVVLGLAGTMIAVLWQVQALEQTQLKKSKVAADTANQAKSEFLANMSHELRTPLNGILGYAEILSRANTWGEKEQHGVNIIYQCGSHLLMLINDILDLSKIEARKMELHPRALHFPSFLQSIVEIIRIRAEQKGIKFVYLPSAHLPEGIQADEKRLRQVLLNLLGNAVKFTERGTVTFKAEVIGNEPQSTAAKSASSVSKIKFSVEDTGVGIKPELLDKIFLPFEQVGDQKRHAEGTGLGLAISSKIVTMMGGKIQVESQLGQGSTFSFEVDLPIAADWIEAATLATGKKMIGYQGRTRSVLIVDDKWENRSVLSNLLEPLGFTVFEAENGQIGLEKATQLQPDLIIADLLMPVMDGYELLKQLRSSEAFQATRIIVSSASVSQLDQQSSMAAGADDFLAKPVQVEELFQLLEKHLAIVWDYESPTVEHPLETSSSPLPLITPAVAELTQLLELAQQGRLQKLIEEANQIMQQDDRYAPFVQQILQWAKDFQTEKIELFLQQQIKTNP